MVFTITCILFFFQENNSLILKFDINLNEKDLPLVISVILKIKGAYPLITTNCKNSQCNLTLPF